MGSNQQRLMVGIGSLADLVLFARLGMYLIPCIGCIKVYIRVKYANFLLFNCFSSFEMPADTIVLLLSFMGKVIWIEINRNTTTDILLSIQEEYYVYRILLIQVPLLFVIFKEF